eukprot:TRINITY_DN5207_c0_g1_i1.p1 TRINITY_DN5207_c0_g1~~TRINITY_DN5207_c0_g1_i1.p1  ORF type:complete len:1380 (+),score=372.57 TRINITY_DN5207_c0_g1_i1:154-4293(+)
MSHEGPPAPPTRGDAETGVPAVSANVSIDGLEVDGVDVGGEHDASTTPLLDAFLVQPPPPGKHDGSVTDAPSPPAGSPAVSPRADANRRRHRFIPGSGDLDLLDFNPKTFNTHEGVSVATSSTPDAVMLQGNGYIKVGARKRASSPNNSKGSLATPRGSAGFGAVPPTPPPPPPPPPAEFVAAAALQQQKEAPVLLPPPSTSTAPISLDPSPARDTNATETTVAFTVSEGGTQAAARTPLDTSPGNSTLATPPPLLIQSEAAAVPHPLLPHPAVLVGGDAEHHPAEQAPASPTRRSTGASTLEAQALEAVRMRDRQDPLTGRILSSLSMDDVNTVETPDGKRVVASLATRRAQMSSIADDMMQSAPDSLGTSEEDDRDGDGDGDVVRRNSGVSLREVLVEAQVPPAGLMEAFISAVRAIDFALYEQEAARAHEAAAIPRTESDATAGSSAAPSSAAPTFGSPAAASLVKISVTSPGEGPSRPPCVVDALPANPAGADRGRYAERGPATAAHDKATSLGADVLREALGMAFDTKHLLLSEVVEDGPAAAAGAQKFSGRQLREAHGRLVSTFLQLAEVVAEALLAEHEATTPTPAAARNGGLNGHPPLPSSNGSSYSNGTGEFASNGGASPYAVAEQKADVQRKYAPGTRRVPIKMLFSRLTRRQAELTLDLPHTIASPPENALNSVGSMALRSHASHESHVSANSDEHPHDTQAREDHHSPFLCMCSEHTFHVLFTSFVEVASLVSVSFVIFFALGAPFLIWVSQGNWGDQPTNLTAVMDEAVSDLAWDFEAERAALFPDLAPPFPAEYGEVADKDGGFTLVTIPISLRRAVVSVEWAVLIFLQFAIALALSTYDQLRFIGGVKLIVFVVVLVWIHSYAVYGVTSYWLQLFVSAIVIAVMDTLYLYACGWKHSFMLLFAVAFPYIYSWVLSTVVGRGYLSGDSSTTTRAWQLGLVFPIVRVVVDSLINSFARLLIISDHPGLYIAATLPTVALNASFIHLMSYKAEPWVAFVCFTTAQVIHFINGLWTIPRARLSDLLLSKVINKFCPGHAIDIPLAAQGLWIECRHGLHHPEESLCSPGAERALTDNSPLVGDTPTGKPGVENNSFSKAHQPSLAVPSGNHLATPTTLSSPPVRQPSSLAAIASHALHAKRQTSSLSVSMRIAMPAPAAGGGGGDEQDHEVVYDESCHVQLFLDQVTGEYFCGRMLDYTATLCIGMYIVVCGGTSKYFFNPYPTPAPDGPDMHHTGALMGFQLSLHFLDNLLTVMYQWVPVCLPYFRLSPLEFALRMGHRRRTVLLVFATVLLVLVSVLSGTKVDTVFASCSAADGPTHLVCLAEWGDYTPPANLTQLTAYVYPDLNETQCCVSENAGYLGGVFLYFLP